MAALTGLYISQSYGGVIHLSTNTAIVGTTPTQLQDGIGNNMGVWFNGAGNVSASSFTGLASSATSASYTLNATSASYALNATTASYTSTSSFVGPTLNQNLIISGSTAGVVRTLTISSQTASMDLSTADLFTLTLVSGSTTFLNPTNIKSGQTAVIKITQPSSSPSNLSWNSTIQFPQGYAYTASQFTNAVDTISLASFDGTTIQAVAAYKYQ